MEGKKLNLNQPLLSVRKYSSTAASKTVNEAKNRPFIPPSSPYRSELKSGPVGNPGAVPFQWELIPGRPKEVIKRQIQAVSIPHDSLTGSIMDVKINDSERREENKDSGLEDRDESYVNALESFFLHCGTNGSFSMDQRTQEFFKDKFLPQHASKRQSPVQEGEKSDNECDQHVNLPAICCLLPRFCLKSSICILNPVSAMNMRTRVLTSPANRIQPSSSSPNEYKSHIFKLKPVEKSSKNESSRLMSHGTSTHCEDKDIFALPEEIRIKGLKTFQELLADQRSSTELDSGSSHVEKTSHVATIENMENTRYCPIDTQDTEIKTKGTDQMHVKDSSHEDHKNTVSSIDKSRDLNYKQDSTTTEKIEVSEKQTLNTLKNSHEKYSEFPVLPPLHSPSDSWLRRTLPSHLASAKYPQNEKKMIVRRKLRLNRRKS